MRKPGLSALFLIAVGTGFGGFAWTQQIDVPQAPQNTESPAPENPDNPQPASPAPVDPEAALHHSAVLGGLNKITAKVSHIELEQDVPAKFGSLEITLRTCKASPPEEAPEVTAFLEISDIADNQPPKLLFKGWMFASSPSLSALDHPIYDVWVIACKTSPADASSSSK
jgi:hypothetical protein